MGACLHYCFEFWKLGTGFSFCTSPSGTYWYYVPTNGAPMNLAVKIVPNGAKFELLKINKKIKTI